MRAQSLRRGASTLFWWYTFRMTRTIVGVLRGGPSSEYDLSLKTGATMLAALPEESYETRDIFVDKSGVWHVRGIPTDPARALAHVDVVLNALHGSVGEDGTVQRLLQRSGVRYAGARPLGASQSSHKARAIEILRNAGLRVPQSITFSLPSDATTGDMARDVFAQFGPPYIIKPISEGAGHGIRIVSQFGELPDAIGDVLDEFGAALVQQFIRGDDASVGIIEGFRGQELYALPPVHTILPQGSHFYSREHHEQATANHVVPSNFPHEVKQALEAAAREAHKRLGMMHFSHVDFIVSHGRPYILEVDATPRLYDGASLPQALESVGSSTREFLEHAISLA